MNIKHARAAMNAFLVIQANECPQERFSRVHCPHHRRPWLSMGLSKTYPIASPLLAGLVAHRVFAFWVGIRQLPKTGISPIRYMLPQQATDCKLIAHRSTTSAVYHTKINYEMYSLYIDQLSFVIILTPTTGKTL